MFGAEGGGARPEFTIHSLEPSRFRSLSSDLFTAVTPHAPVKNPQLSFLDSTSE